MPGDCYSWKFLKFWNFECPKKLLKYLLTNRFQLLLKKQCFIFLTCIGVNRLELDKHDSRRQQICFLQQSCRTSRFLFNFSKSWFNFGTRILRPKIMIVFQTNDWIMFVVSKCFSSFQTNRKAGFLLIFFFFREGWFVRVQMWKWVFLFHGAKHFGF